MPLKPKDASKGATGTDGQLKVGGIEDCITVKMVDRTTAGTTTTPAHIEFTKKGSPNGVCKQVLDSDPVKKAYLDSKVTYTDKTKSNQSQTISNAIAIGSSTSVYTK